MPLKTIDTLHCNDGHWTLRVISLQFLCCPLFWHFDQDPQKWLILATKKVNMRSKKKFFPRIHIQIGQNLPLWPHLYSTPAYSGFPPCSLWPSLLISGKSYCDFLGTPPPLELFFENSSVLAGFPQNFFYEHRSTVVKRYFYQNLVMWQYFKKLWIFKLAQSIQFGGAFEHWVWRSEYYSQRCIDIASNRLTSRLVNQKSRFLGPGSAQARKKVNIDPDLIQKEDDGTFSVPSETKADVSYSVDMELRICSCQHGRLKGPCKHRKLVAITQNIPSFDLIPESSPQMRQMWMYLGTGEETRKRANRDMWENSPQKPLLTTRKCFFGHCYVQKAR